MTPIQRFAIPGLTTRHHPFRVGPIVLVLAIFVALVAATGTAAPPADSKVATSAKTKSGTEPVLFLVLDPLAKELACACVKGFGQRDYRKLAAALESATKRRFSIEFSDDLAESMKGVGPNREVIVIGNQSTIASVATNIGWKNHAVAALTDRDGLTTLTASFVVRSDDTAKSIGDLDGRLLLSGLSKGDAKRTVALETLAAARVGSTNPTIRDRNNYSDAALDLLDSDLKPLPFAILPSYALRLLTGCGTVKPGNLRSIGETAPVPFITAFISDNFPPATAERISQALLGLKRDSRLLKLMESRDGFVALTNNQTASSTSPGNGRDRAKQDWPDWRGPQRDGHVSQLPKSLPSTPKYVWKKGTVPGGLAGLSVSANRVLVAERDLDDQRDVYRCLHADTGELLWRVSFPASGKLDYGQAPRAMPIVQRGRVYALGAFGGLRCLDLASGRVLWERQLSREFHAPVPTWGLCSTPLLVDDLLIVNPGGTNASLVALDCVTGQTRWSTPGRAAAYGAFIVGTFNGSRQIVGYDRQSLGGWDIATGRRLWELIPPVEGDFNVPTPIAVDDGLLVSTENNGTRFYHFDTQGRIVPKPAAIFMGLAPDTTSPIITCGRVFGAKAGLFCLDLKKNLQPVWHNEDANLSEHVTLLADDERVLVLTLSGEAILLDARAPRFTVLSRLKIFEEDIEMYSHPALLGNRLFARGGSSVVCLDLAAP